MWRIFYHPDTGIIKYQINIEAVAASETLPYIDVSEKIAVKDKKIDVASKQLVTAEVVQADRPTFGKTSPFSAPIIIPRS